MRQRPVQGGLRALRASMVEGGADGHGRVNEVNVHDRHRLIIIHVQPWVPNPFR